ncbi:hypothetical protein FRC10_007293 [Ceratobasidium sp. 414]|nr:hypothetical protein FRC10_007293 [Ceratobasidium sp. 414]
MTRVQRHIRDAENQREALESQDVDKSLAQIFSGSECTALSTSRPLVANAGVKRSPELADLDAGKTRKGGEATPPKAQKRRLGGPKDAISSMSMDDGPARNK